MIHSELLNDYENLKKLDKIDNFFNAYRTKTGKFYSTYNLKDIKWMVYKYAETKESQSNEVLFSKFYSRDIVDLSKYIFSEANMFPKDKDIIITKSARYFVTPYHEHDYYEFECVLHGKAYHLVNNKEVTIRTGDVIIIPPKSIHSLKIVDDSTVINIGIRKEIMEKAFELLSIESFSMSIFLKNALNIDSFHIKSSNDTYWINNLIWMYKQMNNDKKYTNQILFFTMLSSIYYLMQNFPIEEIKVENSTIYDRIDSIYRYINTHYKDVTLNNLSSHFSLSIPYLSKEIKNKLGKNFTVLLRDIRLEKACILLNKTDMHINEICYAVGYTDESHFIKIFRKKYNITPKQFQIQMRYRHE